MVRSSKGHNRPKHEQLEILAYIYTLTLVGFSYEVIARKLNREGICTSRGKPWTKVNVHRQFTHWYGVWS
jgi:hypothetical protein